SAAYSSARTQPSAYQLALSPFRRTVSLFRSSSRSNALRSSGVECGHCARTLAVVAAIAASSSALPLGTTWAVHGTEIQSAMKYRGDRTLGLLLRRRVASGVTIDTPGTRPFEARSGV